MYLSQVPGVPVQETLGHETRSACAALALCAWAKLVKDAVASAPTAMKVESEREIVIGYSS